MQQKNKLILTGANGLLGRHFINAYKNAYDIHALVRTEPENPFPDVTYYTIDLSGNWSTEKLPENVSTICHLAQSDKFREFPDQAMDIFGVNVATTAKLLDYAKKTNVKNFV